MGAWLEPWWGGDSGGFPSAPSVQAGRAPSARHDFPRSGKAQGWTWVFVCSGKAGAVPVLRRRGHCWGLCLGQPRVTLP